MSSVLTLKPNRTTENYGSNGHNLDSCQNKELKKIIIQFHDIIKKRSQLVRYPLTTHEEAKTSGENHAERMEYEYVCAVFMLRALLVGYCNWRISGVSSGAGSRSSSRTDRHTVGKPTPTEPRGHPAPRGLRPAGKRLRQAAGPGP